MLKAILVIFAALSMIFAHAPNACRAGCIEESKPQMTDCCKVKHDSASHKEKNTDTKKQCNDCSLCKIPPAPGVALLSLKVQIVSADGIVCHLADESIVSDASELPAIPPPRA